MSERPRSAHPRRLAEWLNPADARKVHSLVDKVYQRKNLALAWEKVKRNGGSGGVDGQNLVQFEKGLEENLDRLHQELKSDTYRPSPVREHRIPKAGQPGRSRVLGIPTIYDRVCQQALLQRLDPIFEPVFDEASFGYRRGRSTKDALRKVWRELASGNEWVVDADLRDFFATVDHDKLLTLMNQRISDGRVLRLVRSMLEAGCVSLGRRLPTEQGTPQGGVVSPLLSNILLTPFDREMRRKGYQLTRYCDDWVVTCRSRAEAQSALAAAKRVLRQLGVVVNEEKTRIVHVQHGFDFLGYRIRRGSRPLRLAPERIRSSAREGTLYAFPRAKSIQHLMDQIRARTRRRIPRSTWELIQVLNPIIRGWGNYYCSAHVRRIFNRLDRWIVRRLWSHRHKRWRCAGWNTLPTAKLREMGLVSLISLIPSLASRRESALS